MCFKVMFCLEKRSLQKDIGKVFLLTGLSGAGKTTLANHIEARFIGRNFRTVVFDGDVMRRTLCSGLSFSLEDRAESIRRIACVAQLFVQKGFLCFCACIAPLEDHREIFRSIIGEDYFEIYIQCPLQVCQSRDTKGLYAKVNNGLIQQYTGVTSPYERPYEPHLILDTNEQSIEQCLNILDEFILGVL